MAPATRTDGPSSEPEFGGTTNLVASNSGIDRALQVIYAVANSRHPDVGVSELSRSLGYSKTVVHRVVRSLVATGYFAFDERTRRYRLGPGAVKVGLAAMAQMDVPKIAQPHMETLVAQTSETATLSARYGNQRMYLTQVLSPHEIQMSVQLGVMYPLHAGASSKAILSAMDDADVDFLLRSIALDALTSNTIQDAAQLTEELQLIRARGYAVSRGERQQGAASVAAPILEATGVVYGSLSVCGPVNRLSEQQIDEFAPLVTRTAMLVSEELGYTPE